MEAVIRLENFSVKYGKIKAIDGISLDVPPGPIGLLGPNGAGKSSLIKALLGLIPSEGHAELLGRSIAKGDRDLRLEIGYFPENETFLPSLNAVTFTSYFGKLCGLPSRDAMQRAHEALLYVGLGEAKYRNLETYSSGMIQRIKLAQALVHDPQLMFLDEPTNGMDPRGRQEMLDLIRDIGRNKGISIIFSSHLLPDVQYVCNDIIILDHGRIKLTGRIDDLRGDKFKTYIVRVRDNKESFISLLKQKNCLVSTSEDRESFTVELPENANTELFFEVSLRTKSPIRQLDTGRMTLEDVFAEALT